jgi:hypothetical protein
MKMAVHSSKLTERIPRWYNIINGSMYLPIWGLQTIK